MIWYLMGWLASFVVWESRQGLGWTPKEKKLLRFHITLQGFKVHRCHGTFDGATSFAAQ